MYHLTVLTSDSTRRKTCQTIEEVHEVLEMLGKYELDIEVTVVGHKKHAEKMEP